MSDNIDVSKSSYKTASQLGRRQLKRVLDAALAKAAEGPGPSQIIRTCPSDQQGGPASITSLSTGPTTNPPDTTLLLNSVSIARALPFHTNQ